MKKTWFALSFCIPAIALAQTAIPASSRIDQVLVYPGGATIERIVPVKAGQQQQLRLSCLSSRFDIDSLQLTPEPGVNIGEITVQTVDRATVPECANTPLDARIRELEDQQAAVTAESAALDLALGYLKNIGNGETRGPATPNAQIPGTVDTLRRSGLEALQRQNQLQRRKEDIEKQLAPLQLEAARQKQGSPQLRTVLVRLSAARDTELRLSYRVTQAGWEPVYRAYLDTNSGQVRLERHAQVAQSSGEDWSGVKLRLSTAQPRQATDMLMPWSWNLDILPPVTADAQPLIGPAYARGIMAAPAPAPLLRRADASVAADPGPSFDVSVFQGEFATEFEVPARVDVAATGQRIALALGSTQLDAKLMARSNPHADATAYLVAESTPPAGVWPAGAMQLFRDGTFIGQGRLTVTGQDKLDIFFGRDELVRVSAEPEARDAGNKGFIGTRIEQKIGHVYKIENLHQRRFAVQVLEAAPVSRHEDIKVQSTFDPKPATLDWRKQPGVLAWEFTLEPGASQKLSAEYLISYPKDARVGGMR